jgi:hypothetical protein
MSLPFTVLPCKTCATYDCASSEPGHENGVMISLTRSKKTPGACGIFCHPDSSWNTAYLLHDKLNRRETILHTAAVAVRQVAAYLANEENAPAIREIFLKMDVKELVEWYESAQRDIFSAPAVRRRSAELLRDLDDAATLVGECGEYRPDIKFVKPVPFQSRQMADSIALYLSRHHDESSKSHS